MSFLKQLSRSLIVAVAVGSQAAWAQSTPVERPSLKAGSEWTYAVDNSKREKPTPASTLKRVVREVKGDEYVLDLVTPAGTRLGAMTLDLNPFSEGMTVGSARASAGLPYFEFPLSPGKTYGAKLNYPSPFNGSPIAVEMSTKVLDWEDVTVPAGKFKALKVEAIGKSVGQGFGGRRNATLWYVPEVGHFVRMELDLGYGFPGKQIYELTSYSLK